MAYYGSSREMINLWAHAQKVTHDFPDLCIATLETFHRLVANTSTTTRQEKWAVIMNYESCCFATHNYSYKHVDILAHCKQTL